MRSDKQEQLEAFEDRLAQKIALREDQNACRRNRDMWAVSPEFERKFWRGGWIAFAVLILIAGVFVFAGTR